MVYEETIIDPQKAGEGSRSTKYLGNNKWAYTIREILPGCGGDFNVKVDTSKSPNIQIIIEIEGINPNCPEKSFTGKTKEGTFNAPQNAQISYIVHHE